MKYLIDYSRLRTPFPGKDRGNEEDVVDTKIKRNDERQHWEEIYKLVGWRGSPSMTSAITIVAVTQRIHKSYSTFDRLNDWTFVFQILY